LCTPPRRAQVSWATPEGEAKQALLSSMVRFKHSWLREDRAGGAPPPHRMTVARLLLGELALSRLRRTDAAQFYRRFLQVAGPRLHDRQHDRLHDRLPAAAAPSRTRSSSQ
jgi:hypothetical protein